MLTGPRIFSTAWLSVRPCTASSSRCVITSPARIPAFAAGVSSIGATTLISPSSIVTSIPSPPNSPRVLNRHVAEVLGVKVARVRVEPVEHAVDSAFNQLQFVRLLDVVRTHALENVAEQVELPISVGGRCSRARPDPGRRLGDQSRERGTDGRTNENQDVLRIIREPSFRCRLSSATAAGPIGSPSFRHTIAVPPGQSRPTKRTPPEPLFPTMVTEFSGQAEWPMLTEVRSIPTTA